LVALLPEENTFFPKEANDALIDHGRCHRLLWKTSDEAFDERMQDVSVLIFSADQPASSRIWHVD
jgi:hypothetical protein